MRIRGKVETWIVRYRWNCGNARNLSVSSETSVVGNAEGFVSHNSRWVSLGIAAQVSLAGLAHYSIASAVCL